MGSSMEAWLPNADAQAGAALAGCQRPNARAAAPTRIDAVVLEEDDKCAMLVSNLPYRLLAQSFAIKRAAKRLGAAIALFFPTRQSLSGPGSHQAIHPAQA